MSKKIYLLTALVLTCLLSCFNETKNSCDTKGSGSWAGYDVCYRVSATNYNRGKLAVGDSTESLQLEFTGVTRAPFSRIVLNTLSYSYPQDTIQKFETGVEYFNSHASPWVQNMVETKTGSFKFTKIDRTKRLLSGSFSYTYVENLTQGNVNRVISAKFSDVSF